MEGPDGVDGVTMRAVAAAAGVSTMATYKHFQSRDALLRAATTAEYPRIAGYFARAMLGQRFQGCAECLNT
jgi:AcrR family transcriptional regulator